MRTVCVFVWAVAMAVWGQVSTARFEGVVLDGAGAVIPNARVVAIASKTGNSVRTSSGLDGFFVFPSLAPDTYRVTVESPGFRKLVLEQLELNAASTVNETLKLEIGQLPESVSVVASTEKVQVSDAQISKSITLREVESLPQLGRNPLALINYQAGMSIDPSNTSFTRVNGLRQGSNTVLIDGISGSEPVTPRIGNPGVNINTDTIEELRIVTAGGKAEYGRQGGAQVQLITRTGTNRWSGALSNFHRNTLLNANNFFNNTSSIARPTLVRNIFGGSLGGPIRKDKLFLFGNYQGLRQAQQVTRNRTVPTAEFKRGLFRWRQPGSGAVQTFNLNTADPRGIGVDREMKKLFDLYPDPNNFEIGDGFNSAGYRWNVPAPSDENSWTVRADYLPAARHRIFWRGSLQYSMVTDTVNNTEATFPGRPGGVQDNSRRGFSFGWDGTFGSRVINELRAGYQNGSFGFARQDRIPGPTIITNRWADIYNPAFSNTRKSPLRELTNNTSFLQGRHTWKVGVNIRFLRQFSTNDTGIYPNVTTTTASGNAPPTSIGPSGASLIASADRQVFEDLYNDYFGRMSQVTVTYQSDLERFFPVGTPRVRNSDYRDYAGFLQDDWKVNARLTLSYGLRWEAFLAPTERDQIQGRFDRIHEVTARGGIDNLRVVRDPKWYNNDFNNLAPRLGIAWDPWANGRSVVRASYGIYYERMIGAAWNLVDSNTPGATQGVLLFPNTGGGDRRIADGIPIPPQPSQVIVQQPATRQTSVVAFDPNLKTPYTQHFTLQLQRELFRNTVLEAGYVGTRGVGLFNWLEWNQLKTGGDFLNGFSEIARWRAGGAIPGADNPLARIYGSAAAAVMAIGGSVFDQGRVGIAADTADRLNFGFYPRAGLSPFYLRNFPQFNQFWFGANVGHSTYHAFQTTLRRQAGALKFALSYTWSKALDNLSGEGNGTTANIDNFNLNLNRGRGDYDRPHAMVYTAVYTLPIGRGHWLGGDWPHWADTLFGGWDVGALGIIQSGEVLTIFSGRRTTGSTQNSWANYSGDRNIGSLVKDGGGVHYFTAADFDNFSFPGANSIGNSGRNTFRGPGYWNVDLAVSKSFRFAERIRAEFRGEAYNLTNTPQFNDPNVSLTNRATFGRITSMNGGPRILQCGLRFLF